jgi:phosphoglycerate dehydrogenase-like enzyme
VLAIAAPLTAQTRGLIGAPALAALKHGAGVLNVGRGPIIDSAALAEALRAGTVSSAILDVFEEEPLPADHPLWTTPGVLITPHTAGYGPYLDERRFEILLENCRRFLADRPLRNVVDKASWF